MSDYFAELEAHLLDAARRERSPLPRRSGRRRPPAAALRRWAPALAALAVVAAAAAVLLAPRPADDERPVGPAGVLVPLASGERAEPCDAQPVDVPRSQPPDAVTRMLGVLRRAQHEPDALPPLGYGGGPYDTSQWLPVGSYDPRAVRRPANHRTPVHVVPTAQILQQAPACAEPRSRGAGVCLVAVNGPPLTRCFTAAEVRGGRAFMLADGTGTGARLVGLVPDGVASVSVTVRGRTYELTVSDNMVQRYVSRLRTGDRAHVLLHRERPGCAHRVSPALRAAVPALAGPAPGVPPPAGLAAYEADGTDVLQERARIAGRGRGVTYWVAPERPPGADPCAAARRACVYAQTADGEVLPGSACAAAGNLARAEAWVAAPLRGETLFYALVPADVTGVVVRVGGRRATAEVSRGVAMGVLPLPWSDAADVAVRYQRG